MERLKGDKWRNNTEGIIQLERQVRFDILSGDLVTKPLSLKPLTFMQRVRSLLKLPY